MDWTQMFLDFIAAIAWPLVVVVAVIVLQEPLRGLLSRLTSLSAAGAKATFNDAPADKALGAVVPVPELAEDDADGDGEASAEPEPTVEEEPGADRVTMSRDELEALAKSFAEAGWEARSTLQFKNSVPTPIIRWNDAGRPYIFVWRAEPRSARAALEEAKFRYASAADEATRLDKRAQLMDAAAYAGRVEPAEAADAHLVASLAADTAAAEAEAVMRAEAEVHKQE